ncbi:aminotransferase class I/II-fold pyridoxal phosphate-dependent enzyme [Salirhabdus salicampi]|uniref:aminotransferase class I/II-fold pyridoxal phosphate-dependent enzyme n=1 Tax=Salirhabdus salicampi TaxID=476102 RepID=UPI0020C303DB|nr:aminotransferase class I/II-fold pyridoxal phosphate-dependent enzyme [Salirhabdus salicampi]MCP8618150.1 aminotransferase class I/II-fold pyridoxal phosphate-dependent enzyme [Salirhabdus salicampi]
MVNQMDTPLWNQLQLHAEEHTLSFHVPGHKHGMIFPNRGKYAFGQLLKYDLTELPHLDDLHQPEGVIEQAQNLAAELYGVDYTAFLIGGSTVGNLTMIFATCQPGDQIIVQRNSHKSIFNAIELRGLQPILISPTIDSNTGRFSHIPEPVVTGAIRNYPDAKALILTYPDYFGSTYPIKNMIKVAHEHNIPVLVDEAHGPHFILGNPFPTSSLKLGADIVVQSAHKILPSMTMSSYLHVNSQLVQLDTVKLYLQMLQSSSPSYPLLASLDLARYFLANLTNKDIEATLQSIESVRKIFKEGKHWYVENTLPTVHDPLKVTLHVKNNGKEIARLFERYNIYPELHTKDQILFIHGLTPFNQQNQLRQAVFDINRLLEDEHSSFVSADSSLHFSEISAFQLSYEKIIHLKEKWMPWDKAIGHMAARSVTPYPPGIPFLIKGEVITTEHVKVLKELIHLRLNIHYSGEGLDEGIYILD